MLLLYIRYVIFICSSPILSPVMIKCSMLDKTKCNYVTLHPKTGMQKPDLSYLPTSVSWWFLMISPSSKLPDITATWHTNTHTFTTSCKIHSYGKCMHKIKWCNRPFTRLTPFCVHSTCTSNGLIYKLCNRFMDVAYFNNIHMDLLFS